MHAERNLFTRERHDGLYYPFTYLLAKVSRAVFFKTFVNYLCMHAYGDGSFPLSDTPLALYSCMHMKCLLSHAADV